MSVRSISFLSSCALAVSTILAATESRAAGWADSVTILDVTVDASGVAYFRTNVTLDTTNGAASCAASGGGVIGQAASTNRMSLAFDSNTAQGKSILSQVTSAYLSTKPIKVLGTGSCMATSAGSIEILSVIRLKSSF